jgi:hypothetical protein
MINDLVDVLKMNWCEKNGQRIYLKKVVQEEKELLESIKEIFKTKLKPLKGGFFF